MAKLKLTKTELKAQRDALARFQRFLPTLELKKEQLIQQIRRVQHEYDTVASQQAQLERQLSAWVALFAEDVAFADKVRLIQVHTREGNIAGVIIPIFERAEFAVADYDLFSTPLWVDRAVEMIQTIGSLRAQQLILAEQQRRLSHELRITIQRINLFEKVKIPECRENIRRIQIYLGDQQANAVARGKIAKGKLADMQIGVVA
ncbi:MAG: V-type ATP synthase subunit D [bacterium]|nr:V-type ATP synthase subunit D [bacterium]